MRCACGVDINRDHGRTGGIDMIVRHVTHKMRERIDEKHLAQQVQFLEDLLAQGRKRAFEQVLNKVKTRRDDGRPIVDRWTFIDYKDAGDEWRETSRLYCECGRKLRYQYTLANKQTGVRKSFGLNHLTEHTGIPPVLARQIVKELERLTSEKDEIVQKWTTGWTLQSEGITHLPSESHIPEHILKHLRLKMPLLQHQVIQLKKIVQQQERMEEEKKLQAIVAKEKRQLEQDQSFCQMSDEYIS